MAEVMNLVAWLVGLGMGSGFAWLGHKARPCPLCGHPGGHCG